MREVGSPRLGVTTRLRVGVAGCVVALALPSVVASKTAMASPPGRLACVGRGGPTVVLLAGLGAGAREWARVVRALRVHTRACTWDSRKAAAQQTPTIATVLHAVHDTLRQARVAVPYLLVGHSTGADEARVFRQRHPGQVDGLVLIEATPARELLAGPDTIGFAGERLAVHQAGRALLRTPWLGSLPLAVIERGEDRGHDWAVAQANLSRSSRHAALVVATHSDHGIPYEQPALVAAVILNMVHGIRTHTPPRGCPSSIRLTGGQCLAPGTVLSNGSTVWTVVAILAAALLAVVLSAGAITRRRHRQPASTGRGARAPVVAAMTDPGHTREAPLTADRPGAARHNLAVDDTQQRLVIEALRAGGGRPVSFSQLHAAGVSFPATVIGELELDGWAIERVVEQERLVGVRLGEPERPDRLSSRPRRRWRQTST
jgi:pimeloyl-ACP methyl ester carboxylesterase